MRKICKNFVFLFKCGDIKAFAALISYCFCSIYDKINIYVICGGVL